jgi:hypothetical protein
MTPAQVSSHWQESASGNTTNSCQKQFLEEFFILVMTTLTGNTTTTIEVAPTLAHKGLPILLGRAIATGETLGPDFANDGVKLQALRERLMEERFHLAVLGQFKQLAANVRSNRKK